MIDALHRGSRRPSRGLAQLERDSALQRVGRTRRWVIAAAAALTAGIAAIVSAIAPGRTIGATAQARALGLGSTRTPPRALTSTRMPPLASAQALGLQGPSSAPQAAPTPSQQAAPSPSQATPDPAAAASAASQAAPAPSAPAAVSGGS